MVAVEEWRGWAKGAGVGMEGLAVVEDEVKGVEYTTEPEEFLDNLGFKL